jgi:hypothetical protein
MAFGYQNTNPPPSDDHWLAPYWKIGRKQAEMECALLESKPAVAPPVDEKAEWQAFLDWAWKKEGEAIGRMEGRDAVWAGWHARAMLAASTAPAQSCGDAEQSAAPQVESFPYQRTFDAIAAATRMLDSGHLAISVNDFKKAFYAEQADEAVTVDIFYWLETEVTAISCRYHGDPSYDHDAYWMRDRVVKLIGEARNVFAARTANDHDKSHFAER